MTLSTTTALVMALGVCLAVCEGVTIVPCGDNGKAQIEETGDANFTCTDINHIPMVWTIINTNGTESVIGTCSWSESGGDGSCTPTPDDYSLHRPLRDTSVLTVTGNYRTRIAGTLKCGGTDGGKPVDPVSCDVRVVYTEYHVSDLNVVVNKIDWTVHGSISVDKIYASDGHYSCQWVYQPPHGNEISFLGAYTLTDVTDNNTGRQYHTLTCHFSGRPMSRENGNHVYNLTIDPRGHVNESPPGVPPVLHGCPSQVVEGEDVSCTCRASASEPSALLSWTGVTGALSNTSTLRLTSAQTSLGGHKYTCSQYWGGFSADRVKDTTYGLSVTGPPTDPEDTLNLTAIVGGVLSVIIIALIIVIIVLLCRGKCDPLYAKPVSRRHQEAEHSYTDLGHIQQTHPTDAAVRNTGHANTTTADVTQPTTSEGRYELSATDQQPGTSGGHCGHPAESRPPHSDSRFQNTDVNKGASCEEHYEIVP